MSVFILTEEQSKKMASDCASIALQDFIKQYCPNLINNEPEKVAEKDTLFDTKEFAEYWKCHPETIRQKKRKGELPFIQHGRKLLFRKSEIDKLTANPLSKKGI